MLRKTAMTFAVVLTLIDTKSAFGATCKSVAACVLGNNTGSGVGLEGVSQNNVALYGVSTSNHGIDGRSRRSYGVVGYTYNDAFDDAGNLTNIRAGVLGQDNGNANYGVAGIGVAGPGVYGQSENFGVQGYALPAFTGTGVYGSGWTGLQGIGIAFGIVGTTYATSSDIPGEGVAGFFYSQSTAAPTIEAVNDSSGPVFVGAASLAGDTPVDVVSIDHLGNETLAGTLTQRGTPLFRTKTTGADVTTYGARASSPMLEDFGTARLQNGAATVALDRTFASAIDARNYMVFVTPHGDSNSLYAIVGPSGFTVRESKGGRSTLAFDYRIVARPIDAMAAHLPAMAPARQYALPKHPSIPREPHWLHAH